MQLVTCARAISGGRDVRDFAFTVDGGRIAQTGSAAEMKAQFPDAAVQAFGSEVIVTPGFINGHSHAYQILLRGWADDRTFEQWRGEALYKVVPNLTPEDVYWTFRAAFDEMLAGGITTVVEFFYLNGHGNDHAEHAIRAAADAGIRLVLARTWMDADYAPAAFRESIDKAAHRSEALMRANPGVHVCIAPHSLHAASPDMLKAAAQFAAVHNCLMHVHVAEAQYEGAQTLDRFGATPVMLLERLGALNARTVAVHAIYVSSEEVQLLAQCGARVIHNPMTNQYLGDGICDVTALQQAGVVMGLGTDADVKPSVFEEMRAASLLQKIAKLDGSALGAAAAFDLGTAQGARAISVEAGDLRAGAFADYAVIDASGIDSWSPALNALVYRGENAWVRETYVSGKCVRRAGDVLANGVRAGLAHTARWAGM